MVNVRKLKTAIVGCGKVGHTHALGYQRLPEAELVAVCDISHERAQAYGEKYGVRAFDDINQMINKTDIEVISVCTPHPLHVDAIQKAAAAGIHVLTEKPLASNLQDCDIAIKVCKENNVKLGVISQRRFYPPVIRMKDAITKRKIGVPIIASLTVLGWRDKMYYQMDPWRGTWEGEGGGVLVNQTIHQLDLLLWLMGPIEELFGYWDNFNHPYIEVDDSAVAVMRFKSGAVGHILVSNAQKPGFFGKIHVHGSNGASVGAQTEGGSPFIAGMTEEVDPPINDIWTVPGEQDSLYQWQDDDRKLASEIDTLTYYHQRQIEDFILAINEDRSPAVTGEDARNAVELFTAIYHSQQKSAPVRFPINPETKVMDFDRRLSHSLFSQRSEYK